MSGKQTQKEAVFSAVTSVLSQAGVSIDVGNDVSSLLNRELRAQVTSILVEGFKSGNISLNKQFNTDADIRTYCSGLMSNWLKKDNRLNGGVKFSIKNPGSRKGAADPQIKAMRALLATRTDENERNEIQNFIDTRVAELSSVNKTAKHIDVSNIPAELQHLLG